MKVNYQVIGYNPEVEQIVVEFTNPSPPYQKWMQQFSLPDFSKEKLTDHLRAIASRVGGSWERIPDHPTELTIPEKGSLDIEPELYLPYEPNPQYEEEPEWDQWTQDLIPGEVTSPTQETIPWTIYNLTPEEVQARLEDAAETARNERNWYLLHTDHIFCSDVEIENKQEWLEYRQALRDLPEQVNFPKEINWPEPPAYKSKQ